jgi:chemotaxis protein MotA
MDFGTIMGLIGGSVLIGVSVVFVSPPVIFFNLPGLLIVLGGIITVTFIKFKMSDVMAAISVAMKAFLEKIADPEIIIHEMMNFARTAKKEGLIALEKETPSDPFAARALRYLSDGHDAVLIENMLSKDIRVSIQRHTIGQNVFRSMGDSAPAFGLIGTMIGLVQMLSSMDDPTRIGPGMAVALLTTLYGALLANFLFLPLADKLVLRTEQEKLNKNIVVEAAIAIYRGMSPLVLEESLKIFLPPGQRLETPAVVKDAPDAPAPPRIA